VSSWTPSGGLSEPTDDRVNRPTGGRSGGQENPTLFRPRSIAGARVRAKVALMWLLSRRRALPITARQAGPSGNALEVESTVPAGFASAHYESQGRAPASRPRIGSHGP
jgi:hypothetical protein